MKKWMMLPALALLSGTLMADDVEIKPVMWRSRNVTVTECAKTLKGEPLNTDPSVSCAFTEPVDCAKFNSITFDLQIPATKSTLSAQIFWNTSENNGLKETSSLRIALAKDGKMHRYTAVLAGQPGWSGTLKEIRIDPISVKLPFTLGEVELEEDVKLVSWFGRVAEKIEKDEVSGTFTAKTAIDPNVSSRIPGKGLPAEKFAELEFELALDPGCIAVGQLFWEGTEVKLSEKATLRFKCPADGQFHKIKLNLAANPEWKGMIRTIRIDMTNRGAAGKSYRLKDVELKAVK